MGAKSVPPEHLMSLTLIVQLHNGVRNVVNKRLCFQILMEMVSFDRFSLIEALLNL